MYSGTFFATSLLPLLAVAEMAHFRIGFITAAPDLLRRQADACDDAGQSACADGNGCCSIGEVCTYESGVPLCAGDCPVGGVTCVYNDVTACCADLGETCDDANPGFCTPTIGLPGSSPGSPATLTTETGDDSGPTASPSFSIQTNTVVETDTTSGFGTGETTSGFFPTGISTGTHSAQGTEGPTTGGGGAGSFSFGGAPTQSTRPSNAGRTVSSAAAGLLAGSGVVIAFLAM